MQTRFAPDLLGQPDFAESEKIVRTCVHCGFCTATCPTYVLLGDELDGPRGRIYLMKEMLEQNRPADQETVKHIDRCLSCLSCMTTCPSGVHYMHLVDHARRHIEKTYRRPWPERQMRRLLAMLLPHPGAFRAALHGARIGKPFAKVLPKRLSVLIEMAPATVRRASPVDRPQVFTAEGQRIRRVALLNGCAQQVLMPEINEATIRLLRRHGCEVVVAKGSGCCGALTHHLGQDATRFAAANIRAWMVEKERRGLDAVVINASGCGTMVKDYGFMFRTDTALAAPAAWASSIAKDVTELMTEIGLKPPVTATGRRVAYHSACSLQHGQRIRRQPKDLLTAAGFEVLEIPEGHLCCGSAGTYNLLQPDIADKLRDRKLANIETTDAEIVAAGNIGCITQLAAATTRPILHTVQLLDWATGGPRPRGVQNEPERPSHSAAPRADN